jgi:hypothetical protein
MFQRAVWQVRGLMLRLLCWIQKKVQVHKEVHVHVYEEHAETNVEVRRGAMADVLV